MGNNNDLDKKDFFQVLWNYFAFHAKQRMQVFNFYITLECFFLGGFFVMLQIENIQTFYKIVICVFTLLFTLVFFLLDYRTNAMIKMVEVSIKHIEKQYQENYGKDIMIFNMEEGKTNTSRSKCILNNLLSYTKLFRIIYSMFAIAGIVCMVMLLLKII